jgi:hypothetical protein
MLFKHILKGVITRIPKIYGILARGTGGTNSARYCYSVWMRHLVMARRNGLSSFPETVAELGPGDSLGIGLAALLSGVDRYYALDVVRYADLSTNLKIFHELVELFENCENIPAEDEFPNLKPCLDNYKFPFSIIAKERISELLNQNRLETIRSSLINAEDDKSLIVYTVPWNSSSNIDNESVDMIFSQAVLEHVDDLNTTYRCLYEWLKKDGIMSHQIDLKCHATADEWNGHWLYSDLIWKAIRGNRPYLINREPISTHMKLIADSGFIIVYEQKAQLINNIARKKLTARFKYITDEDLTTSGVFIQAIKI